MTKTKQPANLALRIDPELHLELKALADAEGRSLNKQCEVILRAAVAKWRRAK